MSIMLIDHKVAFVPLTIGLEDFPKYLLLGLKNDPTTFKVENLGRELVEADFETELTQRFVKAVCTWGHYPGIAHRVLKSPQAAQAVANTLRNAHRATERNEVREALKAVASTKNLGVSFASKHLRFLDPTKHVVLDSVIGSNLGYARDNDGNGYQKFVADCAEIFSRVIEADVQYPVPCDHGWRIADVEMAIFQRIRQRSL